jgi:hypothetical protein
MRRAVTAMSALVVTLTVGACAPGTPDDDSWRDDAVRATGDVGSAVSTMELALRQRRQLFPNYLQTVAVDSEDSAGKAATRLEGVQPPDVELDRNDKVTSAIDDATSLLTDVRIAVVRGAPLDPFIKQLSQSADQLQQLETSLHEPPSAP